MSTSTEVIPSLEKKRRRLRAVDRERHAVVAPRSLGDILHDLGDIDPSRIRYHNLGKATIGDAVDIRDRENRLFELVDGVLVEKPMGFQEGYFSALIAILLHNFIDGKNLGIVLGADTMMQLFPNLVRMPDVSYFSWERLNHQFPTDAVPLVSPNLAVEILSPSNTKREMVRKREEYFKSGVQIVWMFDPKTHTVAVYEPAEVFKVLSDSETLDGGVVLPGFKVAVKDCFFIPKAPDRK